MAQKRMFDKLVVKSDDFMEMPDSSQNLYFHLSMEADDDGFVNNWKSIMRMAGKKEDDLKILIMKSFIIPFKSGVIVIKHWRLNNYLRNDRYKETTFLKEKKMLKINDNQEYVFNDEQCPGIPLVYPDKYSIEENSIDKYNINAHFEKFWKVYPKKKGKENAIKWFEKNKPNEELVDLMINQIERFKDTKEWKENNGQFIPYPTSWLNGKRWEDEFETDTEREKRMEEEILNDTK